MVDRLTVDPKGSEIIESAAHDAVARVLMVPDSYRQFSISWSDAIRSYGVTDVLVETLVDLGLPHRGSGEDVLFDSLDLDNIGALLGLASPARIVMSRWARSLDARRQGDRGVYEVKIFWKCPAPGHEADCHFTLSSLVSSMAGADSSGPPASSPIGLLVEPLDDIHEFGSEFAPLVAEARSLVFHKIPSRLAADLQFLADTRLADCRLASLYLTGFARDLGMRARPASGFFIGEPFLAQHSWLEIEVGDRLVAADPFFLNTLQQWGLISQEEWPLARSPRNVLWRLASSISLNELVMHGDDHALVSVSARWNSCQQSTP